MRPPPWLYLTLGLTAAAVSVSGCGFQPVYGARTTAALEHIDVQVGQGRIPFLIRESLLDQLARDRDVPPVYRVRLEVRQGRFPLGNRVNNIANRYALGLSITYVLTEIATGRVVQSGFVPVEASYDSADPPYAGVRAEQSAEERAAALAAVQIRLELSRVFILNPPK